MCRHVRIVTGLAAAAAGLLVSGCGSAVTAGTQTVTLNPPATAREIGFGEHVGLAVAALERWVDHPLGSASTPERPVPALTLSRAELALSYAAREASFAAHDARRSQRLRPLVGPLALLARRLKVVRAKLQSGVVRAADADSVTALANAVADTATAAGFPVVQAPPPTPAQMQPRR